MIVCNNMLAAPNHSLSFIAKISPFFAWLTQQWKNSNTFEPRRSLIANPSMYVCSDCRVSGDVSARSNSQPMTSPKGWKTANNKMCYHHYPREQIVCVRMQNIYFIMFVTTKSNDSCVYAKANRRQDAARRIYGNQVRCEAWNVLLSLRATLHSAGVRHWNEKKKKIFERQR